jgi:hypothetical protein
MIVMGTVGYDIYTTACARRNKETDGEDWSINPSSNLEEKI